MTAKRRGEAVGAGGAERQGGSCPEPSFISISARVLVNVEAMNMVESLGNVVRHRKASVIYKTGPGRYELRTVPVISGEALRHAIQARLADLASRMGLPVCDDCRRHEFVKHGVVSLLGDLRSQLEEAAKRRLADAEARIVELCVVEDVGGFLSPLETPVKRTSVLEVGYMVPVIHGGRPLYGFDVQFHVRHAPNAQRALRSRGEEQAQAIYNIESSSALYALGVNVELWRIGAVPADGGCIVMNDREKRLRAALISIIDVLVGNSRVGGHWSSFKPLWSLDSAVAVFSKPMPIAAAPAVDEEYQKRTVDLASSKAEVYREVLGEVSYSVLIYPAERDGGGAEEGQGDAVERVGDLGEFIKKFVELGVEYAGYSQR
ncbi:DevR family CRISPR-associated autoregulator [Pyrobaculum sp.]|uniref:DevR family CRISPR-associated autoregulator n=1 Tax=Pyrobaculum sp. TaxID=2004705 RepID=UPI003D0EE98C